MIVEKLIDYKAKGVTYTGRPKKLWREGAENDCRTQLIKEDAVDW